MKPIYLFVSLIFTINYLGQSTYNKHVIDHGIYLIPINNQLNYSIDNNKAISTKDLSGNTLLASANCERVNILMQFMNPLKFSYDITCSNQIDPSLNNLNEFFNKLIPMMNELSTKKFSSGEFKLKDALKDVKLSGRDQILPSNKYDLSFKTYELYMLASLVYQNPDCYVKGYKTGIELGSADKKAFNENFAENLLLLSDNQVDFSNLKKQLRDALRTLINASEKDNLKQVVNNYNNKKDEINAEIQNQETKLTNLRGFYADFNEVTQLTTNGVKTKVDSLRAKFIKDSRKFYLEEYIAKAQARIASVRSLISAVDQIAVKFNAAVAYYIGCELCDRGIKLGEIPISNDDIKNVLIDITTYNIEVTDDLEIKVTETNHLKGEMSLKNHSKISVDFGAGFLYPFGFRYDRYSTTFNSTTNQLEVARLNPADPKVIAGAMLNIIFQTKTYPVYPLLQVGVGSDYAQETPCIYGGLGLKFPHKVSLSFGVIGGWYRELDKLKVGDVIKGEADLKNDYKYKPIKSPGFYIGIQYSF
jgi:hypothetical protein